MLAPSDMDGNLDGDLDPQFGSGITPTINPYQPLNSTSDSGVLAPMRRPLYRPEGEAAGDLPTSPQSDSGGGVLGITQLPDGAGGAVMVPPPPPMAPPAAPMDYTPWSPTSWDGGGGSAPVIQEAPPPAEAYAPPPPIYTPSVPRWDGGQERGMDTNPWEPSGSGSAPPIQEAPPQYDGGAPMPPVSFAPPVASPVAAPWMDPAPAPLAPTPAAPPVAPAAAVMGPPPPMESVPLAQDSSGGPTNATAQAEALRTMAEAPQDTAPWKWARRLGPESQVPDTQEYSPDTVEENDTSPWDSGPSVPAAPRRPGKFTADRNLIDSEILPTDDPRLLNLQGMSDTTLGRVVNGPDRLALAKQYLKASDDEASMQYDHDLTDATRRGASSGILGSGMLTNRYGDLFSGLQRSRDNNRLKYLTDAAGETMGDNLSAYGAASGAASRAFGEGVSNRGEKRGERNYERSVAEQAVASRIAQHKAEAEAEQQAFSNATRLYGLGNDNGPRSAYETAAAQASAEAGGASADVGSILRILASRNQPRA